MLPIRWSHPPCRNMLVNSVAQAGTRCKYGASRAEPNSTAGIIP